MPFLKSILGVLALFVAVGVADRAFAEAQEDEVCILPEPTLIQELLDWIGENSRYTVIDAKADPPEVIFCAEGEEIPYDKKRLIIGPSERGIYDFDNRLIYLVTPWSAENPRDVGALLHELVHDVQFLSRGWPCPNATEYEAYELYEAWMKENGIDIQLDWLVIYMWSRCPRDIHP